MKLAVAPLLLLAIALTGCASPNLTNPPLGTSSPNEASEEGMEDSGSSPQLTDAIPVDSSGVPMALDERHVCALVTEGTVSDAVVRQVYASTQLEFNEFDGCSYFINDSLGGTLEYHVFANADEASYEQLLGMSAPVAQSESDPGIGDRSALFVIDDPDGSSHVVLQVLAGSFSVQVFAESAAGDASDMAAALGALLVGLVTT